MKVTLCIHSSESNISQYKKLLALFLDQKSYNNNILLYKINYVCQLQLTVQYCFTKKYIVCQSVPETSSQQVCLYVYRKLKYQYIENCQTALCIKCEIDHKNNHKSHGSEEKYISYSEYLRQKLQNQAILESQSCTKSELLKKIKFQRKQFARILETYFNELENVLNSNTIFCDKTEEAYELITDLKYFNQSLKKSVHITQAFSQKQDQIKNLNQLLRQSVTHDAINQLEINTKNVSVELKSKSNSNQNVFPFRNQNKQIYYNNPSSVDIGLTNYDQTPLKDINCKTGSSFFPSSFEQFYKTSNKYQKTGNRPSSYSNNKNHNQSLSFQFVESSFVDNHSDDSTLIGITDAFWKKDKSDKAFYSSFKGKSSLNPGYLQNPLLFLRSRDS